MRTIPAGHFTKAKICLALSALLLAGAPLACLEAAGADGPKNATVLVVRHAEKVENGDGLTPAGEDRARAYVKFFEGLMIQSQSAKPARLIATADSNGSHRPRLTLEPLGKALGLPVEAKFKNRDYQAMVESLRTGGSDGKTTLICWHHGDIAGVVACARREPGHRPARRQVAGGGIRLADRTALRCAGPSPVRRAGGGASHRVGTRPLMGRMADGGDQLFGVAVGSSSQ